jgi:hypothetical protein
MKAALVLALGLAGCATSKPSSDPSGAVAPGPAPWQGAVADRMNRRAREPVTPVLRGLRGATPLVYVSRVPTPDAIAEPAYALAVFDDGTFVYEGHRCVKVGGLAVAKMGTEDLAHLRDLLTARCDRLGDVDEAELCDDATTLRVFCATGSRPQAGSDHCRKDDERGRRLESLRGDVVEALGLAAWLGEPTERVACARLAADLAPHELARTLETSLVGDLIRP